MRLPLLLASSLWLACSSPSPGPPATQDSQPDQLTGDGPAARLDLWALDAAPDLTPVVPHCTGFSKLSGTLSLTVSHGGRQRTASVSIPSSYDATRPVGVVLNFHGYSSNATQQSLYSGMGSAAPAAGLVAVHPEGTGVVQGWNAGPCCGEAATFKVDDVGFVGALLDLLATKICVDPRQVFATGISNGGFLSYRLACELSDRIAAIAPVAGALLTSPCKPKRPIPTFHFHGNTDTLVPYGGNLLLGWPGAGDSVKLMAASNGCTGPSQQYHQQGDVTCVRWEASACSQGAEVRLCTVDGGGHTWPGGFDVPIPWIGYQTQDISATGEILTFFKSHPMPKP